MRGLEGDPMHEELPIFINNFTIQQPRYNLINHNLVKFLQDNMQNLFDPNITDFILLENIISHNTTSHIVI